MTDAGQNTPPTPPSGTPTPQPEGPVRRCRCRQTLVDSKRGTVVHPYYVCPFYGSTAQP